MAYCEFFKPLKAYVNTLNVYKEKEYPLFLTFYSRVPVLILTFLFIFVLILSDYQEGV